MKAQTAKITINGKATLKVMLMPETERELAFLKDALEACEDHAVSAQLSIFPQDQASS
jgi:hypothetical protein